MASIPRHRAGADLIQLSVSQVGPLDELQEDASLPPCFVSASWKHLPSSVCTGDGINELRRLKPGCFAGLWAASRSHTDFCRMSSEMSPICRFRDKSRSKCILSPNRAFPGTFCGNAYPMRHRGVALLLRYGTASRRHLLQFIEQGVNPTGIAVRQFVTLDGFNSAASSRGGPDTAICKPSWPAR